MITDNAKKIHDLIQSGDIALAKTIFSSLGYMILFKPETTAEFDILNSILKHCINGTIGGSYLYTYAANNYMKNATDYEPYDNCKDIDIIFKTTELRKQFVILINNWEIAHPNLISFDSTNNEDYDGTEVYRPTVNGIKLDLYVNEKASATDLILYSILFAACTNISRVNRIRKLFDRTTITVLLRTNDLISKIFNATATIEQLKRMLEFSAKIIEKHQRCEDSMRKSGIDIFEFIDMCQPEYLTYYTSLAGEVRTKSTFISTDLKAHIIYK